MNSCDPPTTLREHLGYPEGTRIPHEVIERAHESPDTKTRGLAKQAGVEHRMNPTTDPEPAADIAKGHKALDAIEDSARARERAAR